MNTNNTTTTTLPTTVQEAARQMARAFVHDKRNNGEDFVKLTDTAPSWMTEIIHEVHNHEGYTLSPDDTVYEFIERAADAFADADAETENEFSEVISEMESDIYTSDLTRWLAAGHTDYANQAIEEFGQFDSIDALLGMAQKMQIEAVAYALYSALRDFVADNEEDTEEIEEDLEEDADEIG